MKNTNKDLLICYTKFEKYIGEHAKDEIITSLNKTYGNFFEESIYGLALAFHLKDGEKEHKDKSEFLREINSTMITAIDYKVNPPYGGTVN